VEEESEQLHREPPLIETTVNPARRLSATVTVPLVGVLPLFDTVTE
jgi:hypothetical protein